MASCASRKGTWSFAIRVLDQGLTLCRASGNLANLRRIAAGLGYACALQGRLEEGRVLLEEAISKSIHTGARRGPRWFAWLSEVYRLAGREAAASHHAHQALELARQQQERGEESLALHQLGVVQAHADPPDAAQAAANYQQALVLADELGMRPLQAHCHRGLGLAVRCHWPAGAGSGRAGYGCGDVPRYGDDLLAPGNRGDTGTGGRVMTIGEAHPATP